MQKYLNSGLCDYTDIATSTIGHVIDDGHLPQIHAMNRVHHVVGKVRTVVLHSINATNLRQALIESTPGEVLVIDARKLKHRACWGEQRHRAAIFHQLAAVVVLGAITDITAIRNMKVPVFAQSVSCLTTRKEGESIVDFDQTIQFEHSCIESGDIMIGDADGVFILKEDQAKQLLPKFRALQQDEQQKHSQFFSQNLIDDYYHFPERI
ncbi:regulator of RNase E activity RraA [Acinetobacter baylyi]|uniref:Putative 4-hydroxy-4-methyl-2-oxoglutarate aldolase n=1 Tax=Acinetobacter baylyi TaxID=202950 RepID=A0ABU0V1G6_ACIBI|nr:RraA family protein [Acinetobacter baylyi]MDQ1210606.1 regulator of RNase E activity RraA [Acinetobacter baylyi]MDR6105800.1 regulator of RNase E activity RraA [Acinetobacter baylyi]MDR6187481.1 regulator of RNase E activity RraA [Acinetobacter baylyi]